MGIGLCSNDETQDVAAITQLVLSERESRDSGWWNRMGACFHSDSRIRLSWIDGNAAEFVKGSIDMASRGMQAKHRVSPPVVRLNGNRAVATLSAIIDIPDKLGEVDVNLSTYARFLYRVERREAWRITHFDAIYMRDELTPAIPQQSIPVKPEDLAPFRKSYRMLCYLLSLKGYIPNQQLAGYDVPESAAALIAEVYDWAGIIPDSEER